MTIESELVIESRTRTQPVAIWVRSYGQRGLTETVLTLSGEIAIALKDRINSSSSS